MMVEVEQGKGLNRAAIDEFQRVGLSEMLIHAVKYVAVSFDSTESLIGCL